ncbi:DUF547 domain-containing protein [Aquariibacter albus]|uniref:DUF547 domain-containing protein n=1 Tax=Aquariibacter albus TaxID=2759899 RepID=A0A839HRM2_9BURK|nr:DUF547 domain-containing protein [Aquariibacter albus]MBB1161979.1 DUF547 domain-containing protein [Aquariibacter albus]
MKPDLSVLAHPPRPAVQAQALSPARRRLLGGAIGGLALAGLGPLAAGPAAAAEAFDHGPWTALLKRHVVLLRGGQASQVRYAGFATDRPALKAYLASLSALPRARFEAWTPAAQMAFLINAYNAWTVELILGRYPRLASIKDLGSLLSSPWKPAWIPLLGETLSLDAIEHGRLRARGRYDDPRIHFAVNCASVGCPMLREEAFLPERLDAQLDEQTARFLADRSRNRYDAASGRLKVSKIFDWYGEDFRLGHRGIRSLAGFFASHAERLTEAPTDQARLRAGTVPIDFLDYDWALNDVPA